METENKIHQWFKVKSNFFFIYDKPENATYINNSKFDIVNICACRWDGEKCVLNYFTDGEGWLDEYKAGLRIKKSAQRILNTSRVIATADNQKFSKLYGKMCAIQIFWATKDFPTADSLFAIAEQIEQLKETVPLKFEDLDVYHQQRYKNEENSDESDVQENSEIENLSKIPTDPIYFDSNGRLRTEWYKCPQS